MIETELRTLLLADATLTANSVKIQPHQGRALDHDSYYVLYTTISNVSTSVTLNNTTTQRTKRVQYDVWGPSYTTVHAIADAMIAVLDRFQGTAGAHTVHGCFFDTARDTESPPTEGRDVVLYGVQVDFNVTYK